MNTGRTIFSQVMDYFPLRRFKTCVDRYNGDKAIKTLTCLDQFRFMAFADFEPIENNNRPANQLHLFEI